MHSQITTITNQKLRRIHPEVKMSCYNNICPKFEQKKANFYVKNCLNN
jgi:hypothetical protein